MIVVVDPGKAWGLCVWKPGADAPQLQTQGKTEHRCALAPKLDRLWWSLPLRGESVLFAVEEQDLRFRRAAVALAEDATTWECAAQSLGWSIQPRIDARHWQRWASVGKAGGRQYVDAQAWHVARFGREATTIDEASAVAMAAFVEERLKG